MNPEPIYIDSKITGGHYAMQTERGKKPFENNMRECISIALDKDDIIVDIGAYVGEYSIWAIRNNAKQVLSYEPTPYTFELLSMNKLPGMELFDLAVVGDDREHVDLHISKGVGATNSIAKSYNKAGVIRVGAIRYEEAIKNATIVKIDVEGAEYSYNIIQPQLRAIILEFHPILKKPWKQWANNIIDDIESAGFEPVTSPTFVSGWSLTGSWQR